MRAAESNIDDGSDSHSQLPSGANSEEISDGDSDGDGRKQKGVCARSHIFSCACTHVAYRPHPGMHPVRGMDNDEAAAMLEDPNSDMHELEDILSDAYDNETETAEGRKRANRIYRVKWKDYPHATEPEWIEEDKIPK